MFDLETLGKWLVAFGALVVVAGLLFWAAGRLGLGALPGDFRLRGNGWGCFMPITTSIVLSLALTLLINLIVRLLRK